MEKTIAIKRAEFHQSLIQLIGQSELPVCVVADALQIVLTQVQNLANEQLQKDIEQMKEADDELKK